MIFLICLSRVWRRKCLRIAGQAFQKGIWIGSKYRRRSGGDLLFATKHFRTMPNRLDMKLPTSEELASFRLAEGRF